MKEVIRKIFNYILNAFSKRSNNLEPYFTVGSNTRFDPESSLKLRVRNNVRPFIEIGHESVIEGNFVFENENGFISIGDRTFIGGGTNFICVNRIEIGNDVMFSWGCTIIDNNAHSLKLGFGS